MTLRSSWRLVMAGALALGGCGGSSKGSTTEGLMTSEADSKVPKVDPTLCETQGKKVLTFDLDRDNRPDVWKLYKNIEEGGATLEILACKQVDLNHDGQKDYAVAYNRKGGTVFEKFDFDFDGRFDAFYQYNETSGQVFEVQRESGFDGRYDVQEVYDDGGKLQVVKHDRNGDGEPDRWEQYVGGELVAILYDDDYDNRVDRREEIKLEKPAKPTPGNDVATGTEAEDAGDQGEEPAEAGDASKTAPK